MSKATIQDALEQAGLMCTHMDLLVKGLAENDPEAAGEGLCSLLRARRCYDRTIVNLGAVKSPGQRHYETEATEFGYSASWEDIGAGRQEQHERMAARLGIQPEEK